MDQLTQEEIFTLDVKALEGRIARLEEQIVTFEKAKANAEEEKLVLKQYILIIETQRPKDFSNIKNKNRRHYVEVLLRKELEKERGKE